MNNQLPDSKPPAGKSWMMFVVVLATAAVLALIFVGGKLLYETIQLEVGYYEAETWVLEQRYDEAEEFFLVYTEKNSSESLGYYWLANIYERTGRLEQAIATARDMVKHSEFYERKEHQEYLEELEDAFKTELRLLAKLPSVIDQMKSSQPASRERARAILDTWEDEELITCRTSLQLLEASTHVYPIESNQWENGQEALLELGSYNFEPMFIAPISNHWEHWTPGAQEIAFNWLATIETIEAATTYLQLVGSAGQQDERPSLSTGDYSEVPRHTDTLFPALLAFDHIPEFRRPIHRLCLDWLEMGEIDASLIQSRIPALAAQYETTHQRLLEHQQADQTAWRWQDAYRERRNEACLLLDLFAHLDHGTIEPLLGKAVQLTDPRPAAFAAVSLLYQGKTVAPAVLERISADKEGCYLLHSLLEQKDLLSFMPEVSTEQLAEADMVNWLCHPHELGRPPDEIVLLGKVQRPAEGHDDLYPAEYYVYKFRILPPHWAAENGWMGGVSGPYFGDADLGYNRGDTFSNFNTVSNQTPAQIVDDIVGTIEAAEAE